MFRSILRRFIAVSALVLLSGCAHNYLVQTWQDPKVIAPRYHTVLVMAAVQNEPAGNIFEDAFVRYAGSDGIQATPGYSVMRGPTGSSPTKEQLKAAMVASGADCLMISRVVGVDVITTYSPGYVYANPGLYYGAGYYDYYYAGYTYIPPTSSTSVEATVQTNIYDNHTELLVWSGVTRSFPKNRLADESPGLAKMLLDILVEGQILGAPQAK